MAQNSAKGSSYITPSLDNLTDVTITGATTNQVLTYNGTAWINSATQGDMLKSVYDSDNDGVVDSAEKEVLLVRNSTGATIPKASVVYINGATGQHPRITLADADTEATSSKTIGLTLTAINNNSNGYIITSGTFHNVDTSDFSDGNALWLSSVAGEMVAVTPPAKPANAVFIGYVAYAHPSNGKIVVAIQNGYELEELHNVSITSPLSNDVLTYNAITGLWENVPSGGLIPPVTAHEQMRGVMFSNNSTTDTTSGGVTIATTGSTIARSISSTNFATKQIRKGYFGSVVSAGRYTGVRGSALLWYMKGGFRFTCEVYISDTAFGSGCRQFYGMMGQTSDLTYSDSVTVASMLNVIGVGSDAADTNLQLFHNDGAGTCTKVDLGANFPANRTAGAAFTTTYSIELYNGNSSNDIIYRVINNESGDIAEGIISSNLPLHTQGLNFTASRCMGAGITNTGQFDLILLGVYSL
jgi:hypothetical protein